jgi:hypothetical protein
MEKLSPIEMLYDIIYDIKKARIWHLKMPKVITILVLIFKKVYKHALTFERSPPRSRGERQTFCCSLTNFFCQPAWSLLFS